MNDTANLLLWTCIAAADVVFRKVPGKDSTWRCIKHRYRVLPSPPLETSWTGVV